ncbi:MAG: hypothetical protein CM15mP120_02810 [Pseudomonadota bacterium]|nr:MAG: hypothetical protein CM15mP120_02810 [Pseudomonadota bacterium]
MHYHRNRRIRKVFGLGQRGIFQRSRCQRLCDVRRLFLPRSSGRSDRRRQYRRGGSTVFVEYRQQGVLGTPQGQSALRKILQQRLFAKDNIEPLWNNQLDEVLGDSTGVTGMRIKANDGNTQEIDLAGYSLPLDIRRIRQSLRIN